jgi:multidrug resistance efflux pump
MGIRDRLISAQSPWQNGCAERLIGSIRRDCLDHAVVFGEQHLRNLRLERRKCLGSPALQGTVLGVARGSTDQDNKDSPELLSSINPTFTWVRLAQRIPVAIHLTHVPPDVLISAGMTCTVVIKEDATPKIGLGIRKVMAAIL